MPLQIDTDTFTFLPSALQNLSVRADVGKVLDIREGELDKETIDKRLGA